MPRENIIMECTARKSRNYFTTKNRRKHSERVEWRKYCPRCNKHQPHRNPSSGDGSARQHGAKLARAGGGLPAGRAGGGPQGHLADLGRAQEGDDGHRAVRHPAGSRDRVDGLDPPVRVRDRGGEVLLMSEHRWYAIQTTAGHENKVRSLVERRIKDDPRPDEEQPIRQALVPT